MDAAIDWLNNNSGAVMAVLTTVYVLGTLVICYFTGRAQKAAQRMHDAVNRPLIICDFFTQHAILYFRVRNIGTRPGLHIRLKASETPPHDIGKWSEHPVIKNGIEFLAPGSELVSFYSGPAQSTLPEVQFDITYEDATRKQFAESRSINLEAWLREDLGRENNHPLVVQLRDISKTLEHLAKK